MRKFVTALLLSLMLIPSFLTMPVAALQAGDIVVAVKPSEQDFEIEPGKTYGGIIKVTNGGRLDFNFEVYTTPFTVMDGDYGQDFVSETASTLLSRWISFPQTKYHIGVDETIEVPFTIEVPEDVPGGGQYAAIMVKTTDHVSDGETVEVVAQVASLLYAHMLGGEMREEGALIDHSLKTVLFDEPLEMTATAQNTGNVDFKLQQTMTVLNFFNGQEVATAQNGGSSLAQMVTIFPGTSRTSTLTWEKAPKLGIFRVRQRVTFLDKVFETEEVVFICPKWLPVGIVVFFALMIFWLVVRGRRRKQRQPQVF